ncbi:MULTISPECIES: 2-oxoglutarate dehydrogenase, E2 component, dihydrolipoamide succinyltransferase [Actinoalloteichus]|uniref:Dihydrolipoamide acetyltransferase component of pyruvate dehydrogenase complex n=1 Tax=Actinoalloteichus fjordicus TaxID=1612552 RepID=A0AAC9LFK7_9PSEU|nr:MULTISPECIES: 2-oxoglutarate dehydrogenase, E2 component, dihydrolipoamide succinyltransferase [Actinoalloteichus]APU17028.1 2-oxoglutarate dehydrogenase E2 component [Actinoalloteichus fjordicus]APU23108.1 2-oxoglutarate dehydrogenase E2 component [Actinoalloteichus sp. GBA129-24]
MAFSVQMPALGESVTEGTVTRWLKQEGDRVEVDEPLLEVSTDKVDTEIPSPAAGILQRIVAPEDETVDVGAELAVIDDGSGGADAPSAPAESAPEPPAQETQAPAAAEQEAPAPQQSEPAAPQGGGEGTSVPMPALGESVTEGTVTRWLKQVGDSIAVDEPLLEVSTDKVDTEIPSPVAGTLLEISVQEDETVEVGAQLAVVGAAGAAAPAAPAPAAEPEPAAPAPAEQPKPAEQPPAAPPAPAQQAAPAAPAPTPPAAPAAAPATGNDAAPYVTPLVRKLATEHGIDLATLTGTGVGGRIRKQDVLAAVEAAKAPAPAAPTQAPAAAPAGGPSAEAVALRGKTEKMSRLRQVIAQRMVESLQVSAQLTTVVEVDVTKIARLRDRAKKAFQEREGVKLSFLPFFAKATVEALKQHPKLNASVNEQAKEITYHGAEHLVVAVDTDRGLLVPVIHNAGDLNLGGLARKITDLAERTRANKITPDELSGGTFSLTNTGSRGALFDTPIVFQPQVGILGVGSVVKRPVVVSDEAGGDTIAIRSMVYLALSYDHRLVDGADAARFLSTMKQRLEEGAFEADLGL